jgi:hypothetical protein
VLAEAGLPVAIVNPRQVRKFSGAIGNSLRRGTGCPSRELNPLIREAFHRIRENRAIVRWIGRDAGSVKKVAAIVALVVTQCDRMRECSTSGSVRGVLSNGHPYRNHPATMLGDERISGGAMLTQCPPARYR